MSRPIPHREKFLVLITLLTIVPGTWLMGGYYSKAAYWMGLGGWLAAGFSVYQLFRYRSIRVGNPALNKVWILWGSFLLFLVAGLFNPAFRLLELPGGSRYVIGDPVGWLPSVASREMSAPMVLQFSGAIAMAWGLLAGLRSRRVIRGLLIALVINALVLSWVGAWFKLTGATAIMNYFIAVNAKFYASFTYHNHWVAFAGFHLMIATGLACYYQFHPGRSVGRDRSGQLVVLLWVAAAFIFLSLLLCESRTGILMAVGYATILGLYFLRRRWVARQKTSAWIAWLSIIGLIGFAGVGYQIVSTQLGDTSERVEGAWFDFLDTETEVDSFRFNTGPRITAKLINEKPVYGWGWGSYPLAMSIYAAEYLDGYFAQHAHNDWLQFFAELGVLGCFLFLFPLVHMSIYFKPQNNLTRFSRLGVVMLMGMALFEGPFTNPAVLASVLVVFFADLSMGFTTTHRNKKRPTTSPANA